MWLFIRLFIYSLYYILCNKPGPVFPWVLWAFPANYQTQGGESEVQFATWHLRLVSEAEGQPCGTKPLTCGIWRHLQVGSVRLHCWTPSGYPRIVQCGGKAYTSVVQGLWGWLYESKGKEGVFSRQLPARLISNPSGHESKSPALTILDLSGMATPHPKMWPVPTQNHTGLSGISSPHPETYCLTLTKARPLCGKG